MFLTPVPGSSPSGEVIYVVSLTKPTSMSVRFAVEHGKIVPTLLNQQIFKNLQDTILSELIKSRQLFRNAPSRESLEAITPMWGCIVKDDGCIFSPYTIIEESSIPSVSCDVDLMLHSLTVSRSTIRPSFQCIQLESPRVIDFDWCAEPESVNNDLEEVSDIPADSHNESFCLRDPALSRKQMLEERERVRAAFRVAEEARTEAEDLAARFYETHDLSDSESAFSEWASDNDGSDSS